MLISTDGRIFSYFIKKLCVLLNAVNLTLRFYGTRMYFGYQSWRYLETVNMSYKYAKVECFVRVPPSPLPLDVFEYASVSISPSTHADLCRPVPDAQVLEWRRLHRSRGPVCRTNLGRDETTDGHPERARNKHTTNVFQRTGPRRFRYASAAVRLCRPGVRVPVAFHYAAAPVSRRRRRHPSGMCVPLLFSFGVPGRVSAIFYTPCR